MANPNNFIANSDYPYDMVAKVLSGSLRSSTSGGNVTVAHGLGFMPLVSGFWSLSSNFEPAYAFGYNNENIQDYASSFGLHVGANSQNIVFQPMAFVNERVYYYKIYCLVPSTLNSHIANPPLGGFKNFIFNSDLAYLKLLKEGQVSLPSRAGQSTDFVTTVAHNLGYKPFIRAWAKLPNLDFYRIVTTENDAHIEVTDNDVRFVTPAWMDGREVIYRIYTDEA